MNSVEEGIARQAAMVAKLREEYEANISTEMSQLYNQFVVFIAAAKIPLPHIALVLDLIKQETINQALSEYIGK